MKNTVKPLCMAIGLALAGSASAATIDFSGTNFYMKFLDGNQRGAPNGSIDTASGGDQGQFTEMNLIFKAAISPQVEAGGRIQSRSSAAYWTEFGGFGQENAGGGYTNNEINHQKFMKLRGAYVELTPGYDWLNLARIGTSDWGMFDPFTVGKVRYIDRDNYNGFYFKGKVDATSWEVARISLPSYLQYNWGQGPVCCSTDSTQYNEAVYIAQMKLPIEKANLSVSLQSFIDHTLAPTANQYTGVNEKGIYKNNVGSFKASGSLADSVDLRGAIYRSVSNPSAGSVGESWGNAPKGAISDTALKLDVDWATPVTNLAFNFQYFNIGAGYYSVAAARRESDVLLTEGSESAWYNWGNPLWSGGAATNYTQSASNNRITDNAYMDFDESPAESVVGWNGITALARYEISDMPMSFEYTRVDYDNNWQNYAATEPLSNLYTAYQDRSTDIMAFKLNKIFYVMGGLDTNLKIKRVNDKDKVNETIATDDRSALDNGISISVGNQLFRHLYGTLSYGRYIRNITAGSVDYNNSKSIYGLKFAYNLPGFEFGMLTQWIRGHGNPTETAGADVKIQQYRMKAFAQVNF